MAGHVAGDRATSSARDGATIASAMASVVAAARAAWPTIDLAADRFAEYLIERLPIGVSGAELVTALRDIYTSDLYLACACVDGDANALAAFELHCMTVIDRALPRLGMDADAVSEVKQRLRHTLLVAETGPPRLTAFAGRGELRSWIRVAGVHEALAILRRARRDAAADEARLVELVGVSATPELEYFKCTYRREFELAFREAVQALPDRQRMLIKLHFLDLVTVQQIGRLYRVHRATAGRWLEHARNTLVAMTRANMLARLNIQPSELDSILRLVMSGLEIDMCPWFRRRR